MFLSGAQGNQVMFLVTKSSLHDVLCGAQGNKVMFFVTKSSLHDVFSNLCEDPILQIWSDICRDVRNIRILDENLTPPLP